MSNSDTAKVLGLKKALNAALVAGQTQDMKDILQQLKNDIKATEELIRETKIGLAVGKLRTHENKEVSGLAKELVKKWKEAVGSRSSGPNKSASDAKESTSTSASPSASAKPSPSPSVPNTTSASTKSAQTNGASSSSSKPSGPLRTSSTLSAGSPPPPLPAGTIRSSKTDSIDTTSITEDKTRNKCIELVYDALAMESSAAPELILERSKEVESAAFKGISDAGAYRTKMRSLYLTLKDKKNPELRASIISGEIDGKLLWSMSVQDLASAEKKAELAALSKQALFDAQGAAPKKSETDMFECGKCKARRATYYQMQTRSADEPMTTFVSCLACGHNWRFS